MFLSPEISGLKNVLAEKLDWKTRGLKKNGLRSMDPVLLMIPFDDHHPHLHIYNYCLNS